MTVHDYTDHGTYDYFRPIVREFGLEDTFEDVWDEPLKEFELDVSEGIVIEEVFDAAPGDYIIVFNERSPAYRILEFAEEPTPQ